MSKYVNSCLRCQSAKENRQARLGEPTALAVPHNAWDVVDLDGITGLPKSPDGSDAILVMIDSLTGMLHLGHLDDQVQKNIFGGGGISERAWIFELCDSYTG